MKRVVLVGHCGPDAGMLRSAVRQAVPEAEFIYANDADELDKVSPGSVLLLVNRVLEGDFGVPGGIELVGKLAAAGAKVMLVSNYEDAQQEAVKVGALPGIGKTTMYGEEAQSRLRSALA